jgi:protease-4
LFTCSACWCCSARWWTWKKTATRGSSYTALIEVRGVIADKESASADNIVTSLRTAFEDPKVKGVILRINSPGGQPGAVGLRV